MAFKRWARKAGASAQRFAKKKRMASALYSMALQRAGMTGTGMYTGRGLYGPRGSGRRRTGGRRAYRGVAQRRNKTSYTGTNNLVNSSTAAGSVPSFSTANDETGALTVTHREYIRDIYGNPTLPSGVTEDFTNQSLSLNPGLESTFPWLSQVAMNFEEYELVQCLFTYRSTIADVNSSNGQVGTIILTTNYNPSEEPFTNKSSMMGYAHSSSQKTVDNMLHGVECDPKKLSGARGKYVRTHGLSANEDIKSYDHGTFQFGIANTPASIADNTIGELWVSYTVKLRKPKYFSKDGYGISRSFYASGFNNYKCVGDANDVWPIMSNKIHHGVHNSIPCKVVSEGPAVTITFPSWYSGNLCIKTLLCDMADSTTTSTSIDREVGNLPIGVLSGVNNYEADILSFGAMLYATQGNVTYIHDILGSSDTRRIGTGMDYPQGIDPLFYGESSAFPTTYSASTMRDNDQWMSEVHIRVDIASNNVDNVIVLNNRQAHGRTFGVGSMTIDIAEYNNGFGGPGGAAPLVMDPVTGITQSNWNPVNDVFTTV